MAGLIDVGILKPELAGSFAAGYRGAEQARQQAAQAEMQRQQSEQQLARTRQQMQMDDMTMKRLQEDRAVMLQLQERLKAAGQDPDLDKVFDALIATGNPDLVMKGTEGKQRLREQKEFARIQGFDMPGAAAPTGAAPAAPAAAPAAGLSDLARDQATYQRPPFYGQGQFVGTAPTGVTSPVAPMGMPVSRDITPGANALPAAVGAQAPAAAPVVNALAGAPTAAPTAAPAAGASPELIAQTQNRINNLMRFASTASPQMANNALAQARILQDQLELYSKRSPTANLPASLQELEAYLKMTPEQKAAFERLQKIKSPSVTATATSTTPTAKSLAGPVGARAETSLVKAEGAAGIMESANMVREALNTGNVIAGPLAGVRTKFAQVLELAGAGDKEKLVNTRTAIQGLATLTLESRSELRGQGQVTVDEQKLLERARSGNIEEMTIAELQQVVNVSQRLANRLWSSHQSLLKTMETDPAAADSLRYYRPTVSLPTAIGEGRPKAEQDKRKEGLGKIFGAQPQR